MNPSLLLSAATAILGNSIFGNASPVNATEALHFHPSYHVPAPPETYSGHICPAKYHPAKVSQPKRRLMARRLA